MSHPLLAGLKQLAVDASEIREIQFRCRGCGKGSKAAVLPHSPRIAKFKCPLCSYVTEVETRPSAMDAIEDEFNLRLDMKNVRARPKAFSFGSNSARVVKTKHGNAALID